MACSLSDVKKDGQNCCNDNHLDFSESLTAGHLWLCAQVEMVTVEFISNSHLNT